MKDLFSGVGRLNDCDSKLGKTTFVAETDRQIGSGPKACLGKRLIYSRDQWKEPLENRTAALCYQLTRAGIGRWGCGNP